MTLVPRLPPGRANRKALQYASDIHRLRNEGYAFSAIRLALLDAGVSVSLSTVKREASRRLPLAMHTPSTSNAERPPRPTAEDRTSTHLKSVPEWAPPSSALPTGREIAEAFFDAHPSNPLFPTKETS